MKIKLSGNRVLEITIGDNGKPIKSILLFKRGSRKKTDFRKEIRTFLKEKDNFIASHYLVAGFFSVDSKVPIKTLTILQFTCWLEQQKR